MTTRIAPPTTTPSTPVSRSLRWLAGSLVAYLLVTAWLHRTPRADDRPAPARPER